jgi:hypothetical protein
MNNFIRLLGAGALAVFSSAGLSADTLQLKDGRTIQGKYLGGTQVILRFEVEGDVQTFRLSQVVAVTFDRHSGRDRQDDGNPPPAPQGDQSGPGNGPTTDQGAPPTNGPSDAPPQNDQSRPPNAQPPQAESGPNSNPPPPSLDYRDRDGERDRDSRGQVVYAAPGTPVTVPANQAILVRMIDSIDSKHNEVGDVFRASLETDLVGNNILIARRGSDVYGRLAYAKEAGHFSGSSELQLELTRLIIDGREFPIVSGDYTLRGKGRGEDTAKKVGGGAIAGAIIGGIAGGGAGAAIGAGVGSAAGAGAQILTRGHQVKVPSETLLEFRLDQPVTVTPTQK